MRSKTTNLSEGLARIPFSFALTAFAFCLHSSLFSSAMLSHMTEACLLASTGLIPLVVAMVNIQKPFVFGGILDKIKKGKGNDLKFVRFVVVVLLEPRLGLEVED